MGKPLVDGQLHALHLDLGQQGIQDRAQFARVLGAKVLALDQQPALVATGFRGNDKAVLARHVDCAGVFKVHFNTVSKG